MCPNFLELLYQLINFKMFRIHYVLQTRQQGFQNILKIFVCKNEDKKILLLQQKFRNRLGLIKPKLKKNTIVDKATLEEISKVCIFMSQRQCFRTIRRSFKTERSYKKS